MNNKNINIFGWIWLIFSLPFVPFAGSLIFFFLEIFGFRIFCSEDHYCNNIIIYIPFIISIFISLFLFKNNKNKFGKSRIINYLSLLASAFLFMPIGTIFEEHASDGVSNIFIIYILLCVIITILRFFFERNKS